MIVISLAIYEPGDDESMRSEIEDVWREYNESVPDRDLLFD